MNLTTDQRLALAQRIVDEFGGFIRDELDYQIEAMKDTDELDHSYYLVDIIAVPVS
jgi:predicted unusual protein kinase regulating ubiquinone biosynthesis (AarF/ABC1/UbiB family)